MAYIERDRSGEVKAIYRLPQPGKTLEQVDDDSEAVQEFESRTAVPRTITSRQLLLGLMANDFITEQEALDAARTGAVPASIQRAFDALPTSAERVAAAITWAKMGVVERSHPLVASLAAANKMTDAQVDAFFVACAAI